MLVDKNLKKHILVLSQCVQPPCLGNDSSQCDDENTKEDMKSQLWHLQTMEDQVVIKKDVVLCALKWEDVHNSFLSWKKVTKQHTQCDHFM